jgi:hypothetical protein
MMSTEFNEAKGFLDVMPLDDWFYYELCRYSQRNRELPRDCAKRQMHTFNNRAAS